MEKSEVFLEDNMVGMARCPDGYFNLAIIDPQYGIGVNHNMGRRKGDKPSDYKKVTWDDASPDQSYFDELYRVSKNQIIWGANHFISKIAKDSPCWIVWDKEFSEDVSFASVELAWTSFDEVSNKFTKHPSQPDRIHPTQKPVALYKWLLKNYAKPGDRILDTHGGSMSSVIACLEMGYAITCFEKDADYFESARERINNYLSQQKLFQAQGEVIFHEAKQTV